MASYLVFMLLMFSVLSELGLCLQWHICCLTDFLAISLVLYATYVCGWSVVPKLVMCLFLMSWYFLILCCPAYGIFHVYVASGCLPFAHG
jgi:hypothetical protein